MTKKWPQQNPNHKHPLQKEVESLRKELAEARAEEGRLGKCVEGLQATLVTCEQLCWHEDQTLEGLSRGIRRAAQHWLDGKNPVGDIQARAAKAEAERDELVEVLKFKIIGWREWNRGEGQSPLDFVIEEASNALARIEAIRTHTEDRQEQSE